MDVMNIVKKILPMPVLPQKRYIALVATLIYFGLKAYTSYTPDPNDDGWPDKFKQAVSYVTTVFADKS